MSDNPAENVSNDPGTITTFNTNSNSLVSNAAYSQFRTPKDEILLDSEVCLEFLIKPHKNEHLYCQC